ncbi:hypothetical protein CbuD7D7780_04330 [Coxiella burnetii]|nr:YcaO-like family protein [Coxiella burnetii]OYK80452.1 hypothetical protein CbuD7E6568_04310 [Coxiella burnetii]OYK82571.1 hypothetical protein CbuD7D7780_04330 [Coxiella burnetii]
MPPKEALKLIQHEFKNLELDARYLEKGNSIKTWQCFLTTPDGREFIGCGKGFVIQSKVSATFEAFEHYIDHQTHVVEFNADENVFSCAETQDFNKLMSLGELPNEFIKKIDLRKKLPWLRYKSFYGDSVLSFPLFLAVPSYSHESRLEVDEVGAEFSSELSNTTGSASGTSFEEAAIHALNECIERDATSLFLAKTYIKHDPIMVVDKETLPQYLRTAIGRLEKEYDDFIVIVDITYDFGVPSFCASFTRQEYPIQPKGFGTSLNSAYAIERALLEALQPLQLRTKKLNQVEKNTLQRLKDYPLFMDAAKADVGKLIAEKHYKEVDYNHLPTLTDADLKTQLSSILCAISNCGYSAYYSISTVLATNITCVKVLVPGLDKFHLVQLGKKIMPGKRCYDAIGFNESL